MITLIFDECEAKKYGITPDNVAKGFRNAVKGCRDVEIVKDKSQVSILIGNSNAHNVKLHIELTEEEMEDIGK